MYSYNEIFPIINVSNLALADSFLSYRPRNLRQLLFKRKLEKLIPFAIDFRCPSLDPAYDQARGIVVYEHYHERIPLKGSSFWEEKASLISGAHNSRIGTEDEYILFLGWMIKKLFENGVTLQYAWDKVCELHYIRDPLHTGEAIIDRALEWFDFYTLKIVRNGNPNLFSDNYIYYYGGYKNVLPEIYKFIPRPWIVMEP